MTSSPYKDVQFQINLYSASASIEALLRYLDGKIVDSDLYRFEEKLKDTSDLIESYIDQFNEKDHDEL